MALLTCLLIGCAARTQFIFLASTPLLLRPLLTVPVRSGSPPGRADMMMEGKAPHSSRAPQWGLRPELPRLQASAV